MKLTIDNLNGNGETDYTAMLDAEAPPKIVRKLNEPPLLVATLACRGAGVTASAGSKVRLYRDAGGLWFDGYLETAPQMNCVGVVQGTPIFRMVLCAQGEMIALDRVVLSERVAMGGLTAGEAVSTLTAEANAGFNLSGVQDVAASGSTMIESGQLWSATAGVIADCARAVVSVQNRALAMTPVGAVTRTLTDSDPGFVPESLKITVGAAAANDITVIGPTEPALYVHDAFTATGSETYFYLTDDIYKSTPVVLVEDDFHTMALDPTKWINDATAALTFTAGGMECTSAAALRYRNRVELGGLVMLEQTGISYSSGQGIVGGLFNGGEATTNCIAGVMLNNGQVQPVVNGVAQAAISQKLTAGMLYEFRTLLFHPEPLRSGQVYSSSTANGANARAAQVFPGTVHVVLTMRQINPADNSTLSTAQVMIYDGALASAPAFADYLALSGTALSCTLGHAKASNHGAVWVRSCAPGGSWRTRVLGDTTAGAECYVTATELHFTAASEPVENELIDVFYRVSGQASARVTDAAGAQSLANTEDSGTRSMVAHVAAPAPRSSLDCEQAARALLDDLSQTPYSAEYTAWAGMLPGGAIDVQPGEAWSITAAMWGVRFTAIVREVEIAFQNLADQFARFTLKLANDAAKPLAVRYNRSQHNLTAPPVVTSGLTDNVASRPVPLPDARFTTWTASTMTLDTGTAPLAGGGFELRVEGDWGWGMTIDQNLVGRYTTQTITLPNTDITQTFYLRQFDGSTPPRYSPYSTMLNMDVPL